MAEIENTGSPGNENTTPTADTVSTNEPLITSPQAEGPASDEVKDPASDNPDTDSDDVSKSLKVVADIVGSMQTEENGNDEGDDNQPDNGNDSPDGTGVGDDNQPDDGNDEGDSEGGLVTSVNDMITDSVTQLNVEVAGSTSAIAMAQLYIATSHSLSLAAENAVADQQQANSLAMAALTKAVANVTRKKK